MSFYGFNTIFTTVVGSDWGFSLKNFVISVQQATSELKQNLKSGENLHHESTDAVPISYLQADSEGEKIIEMVGRFS